MSKTTWPTVAAFFEAALQTPIVDAQGFSRQPCFTIETICGSECAKTIASGAALLTSVRDAFGYDSKAAKDLISIIQRTVLCNIYG